MAARTHHSPTNNTHTDKEPGAIRTSRLKVNATGVWEVHWTEGSRSRRRSCNTKDANAAQRWLADWQAEIRAAVAQQQAGQVPTVEMLCARWLAHVAPLGQAVTGGYALRNVRVELGHLTIDELTDGERLQDYQDERGASNGTILRELGALRTVLRWAVKRRMLDANLVPAFDKTCMPPRGPARERFLDMAQQAWFWDQALVWGHQRELCARDAEAAYRTMLFACLGLDTAARKGAIYALTWNRVDLGQKLIDYRVPGERVTNKRKARVSISDRLWPVLLEARERASVDAQGKPIGRVLNGVSIRTPFQRFVKAIGMPWVTPHVLRHTFASLAVMNGVPVWDIAQMMGDTIATIEANYFHLKPGHLARAANHYTQAQATP